MSTEVRLPQWGTGMMEGTFIEWFKSVGDAVYLGEPLAEVEADKINANLEAPVAGTLREIRVAVGETVNVKEVVAIIDEE
jgi:pyruvate/2-oxoglutarate dehydrogenase complex dihydrolipoamide acyltransferase (E2) component